MAGNEQGAGGAAGSSVGAGATMADLVARGAEREGTGLLFEDAAWTQAQVSAAAAERAACLGATLTPGLPPHVGVLLDNVPEYAFWLGGAALSGSTLVGINATRRGGELARDIRHADCQLLVTDTAHLPLLDGLDAGVPRERVLVVDGPGYEDALAPYRGAPLAIAAGVGPGTRYLLLFTSGTSGAPKACICSQGRLARIGASVAATFELTERDVCYLSMPMFHSNALMAGWAPCLAAGATAALRRRFSARGFLPDVRGFGATFANYVGKPLSYVLATEAREDDADNPLRTVFGNEGAEADVTAFAARFGCRVVDGYGSTEGGASVSRVPGQPVGSLGRAGPGIAVLDPATGERCPPARFDADGRLANADEAVGELVNRTGAAGFEGYWNDDDASAARTRDGMYWTGDLAYVDADGFVYFAGRSDGWLRVDGENITSGPIERVLARHPDVLVAAVYAVPDPAVGDQVMAALELMPGAEFDPAAFAAFLAAQPDLSPTWAPRFVRVGPLPMTATGKVVVRRLRAQGWDCADPVWWRPGRAGEFTRLSGADAAKLSETVARRSPTRV